MERTNLGVRPIPVGGKTSMGESEVVKLENEALDQYVKDLESAGQANNIDSAKKIRTSLINYYTKLDKIPVKGRKKLAENMKNLLTSLGLDY